MEIEVGVLLAILVMTVVTYGTRVGGLVVLGSTPLTPWLRRFLEALSGSVMVALVLPQAIDGDWAARIGITVSVVVMIATRQTILALALGLGSTAAVRLLG